MAALPKPVGIIKLKKSEIEAALEIPEWDRYSLGNPDSPTRVSREVVQARVGRGLTRAYMHLTRVVLAVRDDLWFESTVEEYRKAVRAIEDRKRHKI